MSERISQQFALGHLVDAQAIDANGAGVRTQQPERQLEDDRLAGAAGAEQDAHLAFRDGETQVAQHDVIVKRHRDPVEHDRVGRRGLLGGAGNQ